MNVFKLNCTNDAAKKGNVKKTRRERLSRLHVAIACTLFEQDLLQVQDHKNENGL